MKRYRARAGGFAALACGLVSAGSAASALPEPATVPSAAPKATTTSQTAVAPVPLMVPALTPVTLEIGKPLSSKGSKRGENFPLRLAAPIVVDGRPLVPAGATGVGEVIEAKHGGMSGSSGVLILVADYLTINGRQLRLRSMHIAQAGADHRTAAAVIGVTPFIGPLGLFVTGGETQVPSGTLAEAKTAENFTVEVEAPTSAVLNVPSQTATIGTKR